MSLRLRSGVLGHALHNGSDVNLWSKSLTRNRDQSSVSLWGITYETCGHVKRCFENLRSQRKSICWKQRHITCMLLLFRVEIGTSCRFWIRTSVPGLTPQTSSTDVVEQQWDRRDFFFCAGFSFGLFRGRPCLKAEPRRGFVCSFDRRCFRRQNCL